jgi:hypothetical protein
MRRLFRTTLLLSALALALPVSAAELLTVKSFSLHDFDAAILDVMGYGDGSVSYLKELGSISSDEMHERNRYEPVRCYPFYVMKDGQIDNTGYNCRTFFCVGYTKGSVVCKDRDGKAYGGVVEINNRVSLSLKPERKPFASFAKRDRTHEMDTVTAYWNRVHCTPYYLMEYDVIVGQGYQCDEVGSFPKYSAANLCEDDWRTNVGMTCKVAWREDEYQRRLEALGNPPEIPVASASSEDASSSSSTASIRLQTFPDVIEGKYGYTAIVSLATLGVIRGYPDGTYRPNQLINRAEFTNLFMNGLFFQEKKDEKECFVDVHDEWYAASACAAKRLGWVRGYPDGRFGPGRTITKGEGLKIVMASLTEGLASSSPLPQGVDPNAWFAPYVRKAVELGILLETSFEGNAEATRADAAVWMYRAAKYRATVLLNRSSASASSTQSSEEMSSTSSDASSSSEASAS